MAANRLIRKQLTGYRLPLPRVVATFATGDGYLCHGWWLPLQRVISASQRPKPLKAPSGHPNSYRISFKVTLSCTTGGTHGTYR